MTSNPTTPTPDATADNDRDHDHDRRTLTADQIQRARQAYNDRDAFTFHYRGWGVSRPGGVVIGRDQHIAVVDSFAFRSVTLPPFKGDVTS
jgi:hypothetical protein